MTTNERITHERAMQAAQRFINYYFNNIGEKPKVHIPARPDLDDDLVLCAYIRQQGNRVPPHTEAALREALGYVVATYKRIHFIRQAVLHRVDCDCLQCSIDKAEAALALPTTEENDNA